MAPNWACWDTSTLEDTFGMLRGEYDLSDNWTAYLAGGAKHTNETGLYSSLPLTDDLEKREPAPVFCACTGAAQTTVFFAR